MDDRPSFPFKRIFVSGIRFAGYVLLFYVAGFCLLSLVSSASNSLLSEILQFWGSGLVIVCILALLSIAGLATPSVLPFGHQTFAREKAVVSKFRHSPAYYAFAALLGCILITLTGTLMN